MKMIARISILRGLNKLRHESRLATRYLVVVFITLSLLLFLEYEFRIRRFAIVQIP